MFKTKKWVKFKSYEGKFPWENINQSDYRNYRWTEILQHQNILDYTTHLLNHFHSLKCRKIEYGFEFELAEINKLNI